MIEDKKIRPLSILGSTADSQDDELKKKCKMAGFDDVTCKPIKRCDIKKALKKYYFNK